MRINHLNQVEYRFFEKPMASNMVIQKESAMCENDKIQCLSNDLVRRMSTTSEQLGPEIRAGVIDQYAQKLTNSGYWLEQTRKIVTNGLKYYERRVLESKRVGGRQLH
jgi:hypothetical protein